MAGEVPENLTSDHYFQALDRVHVASLYLQMVFDSDPVLIRHAELRSLADQAVDRLEQLYQAIGQQDMLRARG